MYKEFLFRGFSSTIYSLNWLQNFYIAEIKRTLNDKSIIMIMLKLIEAKRFGDRNTINIEGNGRRVQRVVLREGKGEELTTADSLNKY